MWHQAKTNFTTMKKPTRLFFLRLNLVICVLSGVAVLISKSNPFFVVTFFITWFILVIYLKILGRKP